MDNIENELAWLAGILDGEGYFALRMQDGSYKHPHPTRSRRGYSKHLVCYLKVETVSIPMLTAISLILDKVNIAYRMGKPTMKPKSSLPAVRLEIWRKGDLLRLCESILPYVVVKKQEVQLIHSYLIKSVAYKYYRISETDMKLCGKMRQLHDLNGKKGISLAVKPKSILDGYGNAELNSGDNSLDKCVENIEAIAQYKMELS